MPWRKAGKEKKKRQGGKHKRRYDLHGEKVYGLSNRQWRTSSGALQRQEQSTQWLKRITAQPAAEGGQQQRKSLYKVLQDTPTPKVSTAEEFLVHCTYIRRWLKPILKHKVGERKVRRQRFQGYSQRLATLDEACHGITGGIENAIVVIGNWRSRRGQGFGYTRPPIMELRWRLEQHARLVVLDEQYTSKRCSNCAFHDDTYAEKRSVLEAGERGECWQSEQAAKTNILGLRRCPNCETLWHRDVNAGRNIRLVGLERFKPPYERPQTFERRSA